MMSLLLSTRPSHSIRLKTLASLVNSIMYWISLPLSLYLIQTSWIYCGTNYWGIDQFCLHFGIHINFLAARHNSITTLKGGDLVLKMTIGIDGSVVASPLYDGGGYNVEASRLVY